MNKKINSNIAVIGLGYVGLPLALEFSKLKKVIAYDHDKSRISELKKGNDRTKEVSLKEIKKSKNIEFTTDFNFIKECRFFIITVPTPIKKNNTPDLKYLIDASKLVAKCMKKSSIVIYESTVYPGCTEEVCLPILERYSNLKLNKDFYLGYSPERINPGKSNKKLTNVVKVISGSNQHATYTISKLYKKIIKVGVFVADSIKIAEAAKIIENTQRDLNIALVNELSIIFKKLNLDTKKILEAAETKWNFASYKPGLVGGHCIGVDPYYLTYKAKKINYKPKVILAGRKINDYMGKYVGNEVIKLLKKNGKKILNKKILIMGLSFKENCVDARNSKVIDIINFFRKKKILTHVYDPVVYKSDELKKNKIHFIENLKNRKFYDVIIIAVSHKEFISLGINQIKKLGNKNAIIFDLKNVFPKDKTDWQM